MADGNSHKGIVRHFISDHAAKTRNGKNKTYCINTPLFFLFPLICQFLGKTAKENGLRRDRSNTPNSNHGNYINQIAAIWKLPNTTVWYQQPAYP